MAASKRETFRKVLRKIMSDEKARMVAYRMTPAKAAYLLARGKEAGKI